MTPIAVTLLTGFLGAGKTTLLRHILNEQHGFKIAVIENEFGEVSVDDQLIGDRATQIKTLTNGCICCTRSSELEDALLDLLDSSDRGDIVFDRLVIECTGMADPGPDYSDLFLPRYSVPALPAGRRRRAGGCGTRRRADEPVHHRPVPGWLRRPHPADQNRRGG